MPGAEGGVAVGMEPRLPSPLSCIKLKGGRRERERKRERGREEKQRRVAREKSRKERT